MKARTQMPVMRREAWQRYCREMLHSRDWARMMPPKRRQPAAQARPRYTCSSRMSSAGWPSADAIWC